MAENPRDAEPKSDSRHRPGQNEPEIKKPNVDEPEIKNAETPEEEVADEDRFQSTDN